MARWLISNTDGRGATEWQSWEKDGESFKRVEGWRHGEWACDSPDRPQVDLSNPDGFDPDRQPDEWEFVSMSDAYRADWVFPDSIGDPERSRIMRDWGSDGLGDGYDALLMRGWWPGTSRFLLEGALQLSEETPSADLAPEQVWSQQPGYPGSKESSEIQVGNVGEADGSSRERRWITIIRSLDPRPFPEMDQRVPMEVLVLRDPDKRHTLIGPPTMRDGVEAWRDKSGELRCVRAVGTMADLADRLDERVLGSPTVWGTSFVHYYQAKRSEDVGPGFPLRAHPEGAPYGVRGMEGLDDVTCKGFNFPGQGDEPQSPF